MKLGRLLHSPEALAAAPHHRFGAVLPPAVLDRRDVDYQPGLDGNDQLTNCCVVSIANMIRARAALNGFSPYISRSYEDQFFSDCAGNPPDLTAVEGLIFQDVIERQATAGFPTGHDMLHGIPGVVDLNVASMASSMARFGSVGLGVTLYERDMDAIQGGKTLDVVPGRDDGAIVGGHAMAGFDYLGLKPIDTMRSATWGLLQMMTWAWVMARCDEAHGVNHPQLARAQSSSS